MNKILSFNSFKDQLLDIHSKGKLVLVGGCFDILHKGHFEFLKASRRQGNTLLVMLESDSAVKAKKGEGRPVNNQESRAKALSELSEVDYVLLLPHLKSDPEYYDLVKTLEPDIIAVTATDPAYNKKSEQAKLVDGKVVQVIERLPHSTTQLIK